MINFVNDYSEGAHEKILERLMATNREKTCGYGDDYYCEMAAEKIKKACGREDAQVYFLAGGTQSNMMVIDTMTAPYEGVVACESGHVNVHEAGAIEFSGHKVLTVPSREGKIDAADLAELIEVFYGDENHEHMVYPGIVYISHPTEIGTLYTLKELTDISAICREHHIPLFLDGARLGYGLAAEGTDVTLKDIAELTDVFYVGGTKVGALYGEALVFTHGNMPVRFNTRVKQHGAMLAKGRILGLQFDTLFTDNLYYELGANGIAQAKKIKEALTAKGYKFFVDSPTNQIFVIIENEAMKKLAENVEFSFHERYDESRTVIRFCTSWATTDEQVQELISVL